MDFPAHGKFSAPVKNSIEPTECRQRAGIKEWGNHFVLTLDPEVRKIIRRLDEDGNSTEDGEAFQVGTDYMVLPKDVYGSMVEEALSVSEDHDYRGIAVDDKAPAWSKYDALSSYLDDQQQTDLKSLKTTDEGELVSSDPDVKWSEGTREFNLKYPFNTKPIQVHAPGSGYVILPIRSVRPEPGKIIDEHENEEVRAAYLDGSTPEARTTVNYADETMSLSGEPLKIFYSPINGETEVAFEASAVLSDGTARRRLPHIAKRVLAMDAAGLVRSASSDEKAIITGKHVIPSRLQEQTVKMGTEYLNRVLSFEDLRNRDRSAPESISF